MPFTAQELDNIATAALDFHLKGKPHLQSIQSKPLLRIMRGAQKTFPGGKDKITKRAKGDYTSNFAGYTHDDTVTYSNPANMKQAEYPWFEGHIGIQVTNTELKKDGITVVDTARGQNTTSHSRREMTALAGIFDDKLEDMSEQYSRGQNLMYLRDGTADAKLPAGIQSIVLTDPTTATIVGGIDQQANTWWRNRASLALSTGTPSDLTIINKLQAELRQLRRFGGRPNVALVGSDFLDAMEKEIRSKGTFTDTGFSGKDRGGAIDVSIADLNFKGLDFVYDPTLDDEGLAKNCFILDTRHIHPMVMDGEVDKKHAPSRPEDKYVIFRAVTWTGGVVAWQRNSMGVYTIA